MKKTKLLTVGMLATFSLAATTLILNQNVWFMVAASAVIGYGVIVRNNKQLQLQRA
jgi:hypothetical protein